MKIKDLIEILKECPEDGEILESGYDRDMGASIPWVAPVLDVFFDEDKNIYYIKPNSESVLFGKTLNEYLEDLRK